MARRRSRGPSLFGDDGPPRAPGVAATEEVFAALAANAPVAIGVSGGKDSCALGLALPPFLDAAGHRGPRLLIHSHLGRTEWPQSLPTCERLAAVTGLELVVVRRAAGDMLDRWRSRWANNVRRYAELSCVKLILPWSTPSMRFCTSEMKVDVICRHLVARFPGTTILSASGIRADESDRRALAPVAKPQVKLASVTHGTAGLDWHPILGWTKADVLGLCEARTFALHEGYTRYGSSRISCAYCILASRGDLMAAAGCSDNHDLYRAMVALEAESTFAFQDDQWLADVAPHLLDDPLRDDVARAKIAALARQEAEARIPSHLLYTKGWPTCVPSRAEARILAGVRRAVADAVGLDVGFRDAASVVARYEELIEMKRLRGDAPRPGA